MPKRGAIAIGLTVLALVLLLNFQGPGQLQAIAATNPTTIPGGPSASRGPAVATTTATRTLTGPTVDTRWGPVQVQLTMTSGKITAITALQLPAGGRSGRISSIAEPLLRTQALAAQGPNIDGVSGATYTSTAYAQSLQAALNGGGS
jgi:uncharacterized protein with FMN-binding domain